MKNINEELLEFYSQDENYDFVEFWFSGIDEKSSKDCIIEFLEVTKNWNVKKKKASKLLYSTAKPYSKDTIFEILIKNNLKIYEETVTKTLPKHRDHFVHPNIALIFQY